MKQNRLLRRDQTGPLESETSQGFKAALFQPTMDSRLLGKGSVYQFSYAVERNSVVDT
ncbi:hypothetical protein IVB11_17875 [Bradyrhizobium sp. 177]|nr:hypothetical protein [Bradyrhizobium sp. 177]